MRKKFPVDVEQKNLFSVLGVESEQIELLESYLFSVLKWNKVYNLTAIKDYEQGWRLHVLDSLAALHTLENEFGEAGFSGSLSVLDVGSGAGFPGVVWAIARPLWTVSCLDAVRKKTGFIRQVGEQLDLVNIQAIHARIESHTEKYDVVVSRAFSSLERFIFLTGKNLSEKGVQVALKSRRVEQEVSEAQHVLREGDVFHVKQFSVPSLEVQRSLVVLKKAVAV